jgi:16S rRNA processing protein RimM
MTTVPTVAVGRVTRAHGVHGEVAVLVLSEVANRFAEGATVWLEDGRALTVDSARAHRDRLPSSPALPEGSWWDHRIEGCAVELDTGRALGTVREVIHTPANDVWSVIDPAGAETLIPVLRDVLVSVDVDARRIVVREVSGLTTP